MYTDKNFKTKKQFREAVQNGELITLWSPGGWPVKSDGREYVEGPHAPVPHSWYATVELAGGVVVKVK